MRKISLEEIAQTTKISLKCLAALEADDLAALPGEVFAKGFIRSYARAIGLNSDEALLQFEEYLKTVASPDPRKGHVRWLRHGGLQLKSWVVFVVLMVVVVVAAYLSSR